MTAGRILAVVAIASQLALQAAVTEELHKSYPLDADGRVSLRNVHGDVRVTAWDRNEVQVDAIKRGDSKSALDAAEIVIDSSSGSISIRTRYPEPNRRQRSATVQYTVKVPRRARLSSIETVHGSVTAVALAGEARLSTVHGDVEAGFEQMGSSISLNTVHGNVALSMPDHAGADLTGGTVHGTISSNLASDGGVKVSRGRTHGGSISGRMGDGRAQVKLSTVHGDIRIVSGAGI